MFPDSQHVTALGLGHSRSTTTGGERDRVDKVVLECVAHLADSTAETAGVEAREVLDEVPLDLGDGLGRHDWVVGPEVERGQQEVAGADRDEDVGIEGRKDSRHQS